MTANYKIATCCYCGTRAALQLRGDVQHELACASCGAPLHNLADVDEVVRLSGEHEVNFLPPPGA